MTSRARWTVGFSVLVMAGLVLSSAQANDEVGEWLDRMARAVDTLNYRGTLVHVRNGRVDTLRIIHRSDDEGIRERIYSLDGQPREILRNGSEVRTLLEGNPALVVQGGIGSRLFPHLPANQLSSPVLGYRMSFVGTDRVAGMMTQVVEILPRDQFRYGHRFWLEEKTGMLLRSALLDNAGQHLQKLTFVDIELGVPISDSELDPGITVRDAPETTLSERSVSPSSSAELRRASWIPARLPDGFRLASVGKGDGPQGRAFEHLLFSDGLTSFSVYVEEAEAVEDGSDVSERIDALGPVHVYRGMVEQHRVTVVGEVPPATVALIARQLERRPAESPGR
jgi:sigma-E factor negative regulatory protein RseB